MYFVALVLPKDLDGKLLLYKKQFQEKYGCKVALKSPAHITLLPPFWMPANLEASLTSDLSAFASTVPAFALCTTDFSAFPPRTIFVAAEPSKPLQELKTGIDAFFRQRVYPMKMERRPFHPHITIATRDLHKKDFAEAWSVFEAKVFRETFAAYELSLLKHNGRTWDVVFAAPFTAEQPSNNSLPKGFSELK